MTRPTSLDRQWAQLMSFCEAEARYRRTREHPRLLRLLAEDIAQLGRQMGFDETQIETREFRAERHGDHIVGLQTGRRHEL